MRALEAVPGIIPISSPIANSTLEDGGGVYGSRLYGWLFECHGLWHNLALIVFAAMFVLYLASHARKSYAKLSNGRSHIMIAYYGFLWLVSILNLAWCSLQAWECTSGKEMAWNVLSLFTTSGMLFLEVSLMAFLLQGNYTSGLEALTRTFVISGVIVGFDILLKAIYLFGLAIPLFIDNYDDTHKVKWGLWVVHKLLLTAVYGFILFIYHSRWRERLPARPAFYNYITVMFSLNAIALFSCALTGHGAGFGFWLYAVTVICYHAFYLPLLYVTFLADFFQEEDLHLENVYYSEMKDAGFFDADWE
ncbi:protein CANDIDATE G-PROTEIN COUPLED RECEPTOR 2-like [Actinidia eriantha]|uniref:protein CANDIDATE G-PROTEIN COUPLED RECEPTOR 2-like n=1 Tax=Actinidia eriantha TaxID=165200 RepID=UPI002586123B|nr:protein CANDIDATE G-PROTEIN COUPLED RECEPTOR 2-like [Actinidia eriantha]